MIKNLLITFDYELFLGEKSGSVNSCMLQPTKILLPILSKFSIKAIFFVDTTYLIRLQKIADQHVFAMQDYNSIVKQLQEISLAGHYIFPHLHPHWLDGVYDAHTNEWNLSDLSKYRFNACSEIERTLMFKDSIDLLKQIITPVNPNYSIDSYRAGGWCIQPFGDFKPYFEKYGINKEFSVLRGKSEMSNSRFFNFTQIPAKNVYFFKDNVIKQDSEGKFIEYTISVLSVPLFFSFLGKFLTRYLWRIKKDRSFGDGKGAVATPLSMNKKASTSNLEMVAIENLVLTKLPLYNKFIDTSNYMHFLSHPKMLTKHSICIFEKFLDRAFKKFKIETDYMKIPVEL